MSRWGQYIWNDKNLAHFLSVLKQPACQWSKASEREREKVLKKVKVWGWVEGERGDGLHASESEREKVLKKVKVWGSGGRRRER